MAKLKKGRVVRMICNTCHGNGYVRVAKINSDPAADFRDKSNVHQCWDCNSGWIVTGKQIILTTLPFFNFAI